MFKRFIFWSPLFVLASIFFDAWVHYQDKDHLMICITAGLGWLMYWEALNDLEKYEKENDTDAKS